MTFYGSSFICGPTGEILAKASRDRAEVVTATLDLDACEEFRRGWGVYRDRRPEHYGRLAAF